MIIDTFRGDYFFLSNFFVKPGQIFEMYGTVFRNGNVEAVFQAGKFVGQDEYVDMFKHVGPNKAKKLGGRGPEGLTQTTDAILRSDWEEVKVDIMREALWIKFSDKELREKLLATGDAELIEGNWWGDRFWGQVRGKGENMLGKLLMETREKIKRELKD